jgi:hypothetical protein
VWGLGVHPQLVAYSAVALLAVLHCILSLQSCTVLFPCSHALHSFLAVLHCILSLQSCTVFFPCSHALYSFLAVMHCILSFQSCTAFFPCSPALYSFLAVTHCILSLQSCAAIWRHACLRSACLPGKPGVSGSASAWTQQSVYQGKSTLAQCIRNCSAKKKLNMFCPVQVWQYNQGASNFHTAAQSVIQKRKGTGFGLLSMLEKHGPIWL